MARKDERGVFALPTKGQADECFDTAPDPDWPQQPPDEPFVTLSHTLTWIAFGVSMDSDQLREVLTLDRYGEHDPQEAIKGAAAQLTDLGSGSRIAFRGKYRASHRANREHYLSSGLIPFGWQAFVFLMTFLIAWSTARVSFTGERLRVCS